MVLMQNSPDPCAEGSVREHQLTTWIAGCAPYLYYRPRPLQPASQRGPSPHPLAAPPQVMSWDDHDIFDGWGSYPHYLQVGWARGAERAS